MLKSVHNEACMASSHMYTTLNLTEEVQHESKEDILTRIYMDTIPAVEMRISFNDIKNPRHTETAKTNIVGGYLGSVDGSPAKSTI
jgi:hypothetical protein